MRRRRPLSLLEVMIAICIAGILFAVLFHSQMDTALSAKKVEQIKQAIYQREKFYLRLLPLFSHLEKCSIEKKRLILTYDNRFDPDPAFCGQVQSALYMEQNCLLLVTWGKDDKLRTELLWEGVKECQFTCFVQTRWTDQVTGALPSRVKIMVTDENEHIFPYWTTL